MKRFVLIFLYGYLVKGFLKFIIGINFDKPKALFDKKQFIIVANHNSHMDTASILSSLPKKKIPTLHPVAAADYFGKTKFRSRISNFLINTLLIPRHRDHQNPKNDPIRLMVDTLNKGDSILIFPEGTRGEPGVQKPFKHGVALVLKERPDIPFVPVHMTGMGKILPRGERLLLPFQATLKYGEPTYVSSTDIDGIMKEITESFEQLKKQS